MVDALLLLFLPHDYFVFDCLSDLGLYVVVEGQDAPGGDEVAVGGFGLAGRTFTFRI